MRFKIDPKPITNNPKNCCQIVHAWIARRRQHPVQALAGLGCQSGELFKTDGCVDQVTQNQSCRFGFAIQKQCCGLVQQRLCKGCIALYALNNCFLEASCQCHWVTSCLCSRLTWRSVPSCAICIRRTTLLPGRYPAAARAWFHRQTTRSACHRLWPGKSDTQDPSR